jgi:hypothetical protein
MEAIEDDARMPAIIDGTYDATISAMADGEKLA